MLMGLEFVVVEEFPPLAPIKTIARVSSTPTAAVETTSVETTSEKETDEGENCSTPKSEECKLRPALVCPPAPRKPRPAAKRKAGPPVHGVHRVPRDLASVFVPAPSCRRLISKRIRVG